MKLSLLDAIVFFVLIIGNVAFGASFFFRNKTSDQFTSGSGKIPAWVVGMSIFATFVSSISFLALPGKAYVSNWNAFVFSLSIPFASFAAVKFFVPLYRSVGNVSAYYYLELRFGAWARMYASICYILTQLMRTGAILLLLALPVNALFGWDVNTVIIITGLAVILYSMLGGIKAVIWTDTIQGIILIAGAVICAIHLTFSMPGGITRLFEIASEHNKFSLKKSNSRAVMLLQLQKPLTDLLLHGLAERLRIILMSEYGSAGSQMGNGQNRKRQLMG